jgi:ubiquitin C-terminal hydrolase
MYDNSVINPSSLKHAIGASYEPLNNYNQNCSHELIAYLIDQLHEDLIREKKIRMPVPEDEDLQRRRPTDEELA